MSDEPNNARREPVEVECSACGETFEHAKRGAVPKRCPECRESRVRGSEDAPKRPRGIEQLETSMRIQLAALASLAGLADPWLGAHCLRNVERAAKVHAELAATSPKLRAALERGTNLAGYGPVAVFWIGFIMPVVVHYRAQRGATAPAGPVVDGENVVNFSRPSHAV